MFARSKFDIVGLGAKVREPKLNRAKAAKRSKIRKCLRSKVLKLQSAKVAKY